MSSGRWILLAKYISAEGVLGGGEGRGSWGESFAFAALL